MSNFIYTTSGRIGSVLLLDVDRLHALDQVILPVWEQLAAEIDEKYKADLEKAMSEDRLLGNLQKKLNDESQKEYWPEHQTDYDEQKAHVEDRVKGYSVFSRYKKEFSLLIDLEKNKKVQVASFDHALSNVDLLQEVPRGFQLEMTVGEQRCTITLDNSSLSYRVSPEHLSSSRELFAGLEQWARSSTPPRWQQLWLEWGTFTWWIFLSLLFFLSFVVSLTASDPTMNLYRSQAIEILQTGVTPENQSRAIEILLALTVKYRPLTDNSQSMPKWFWVFCISGFLACILLSFKPKSLLGIGKGQELIEYWRRYTRLVFIVIPAFIIVNVFMPLFNSWLFGTN